MAIVQTLPVPLEPTPEATTAPQAPAMGSVSSLISGRPCPGGPAPTRHHGPPGPTFFRQQDGLLRGGYEAQEPLCPAVPPRKTVPGTTFTYINEDFRTESPPSPSSDIEDAREQRARNAHLRGPPPKLIPVSGKLEKVYEERQRHWQREREALREDGAAQAQRAQRAQQLLQLQVFQLQQEKRQLQDDFVQLLQEREQLERRCEEQRDSFEGERLAWQAEKEQVIRYQKQLQHNYIQMYRRNRQLEQELQQLSLELEARELADLGLAEPAPCICLEEITATEI
uniref:Leucine zipper tumor suppressor 2 n=1 Tax=Rousettus aegyptiacus TaxID=9407 RepID=A0A7J8GBN5_ROUAE|nr:leucine zipper tumor suppressor 2 [Rousettus aegyptiacus]